MTVHDDLATLRQARWLIEEPGPRRGESDAALSRVEAELARLEERWVAARTMGDQWMQRAEAAEAEIARLRDELERHKEMESAAGAREFDITQERDRLRDGLRRIAENAEAWHGPEGLDTGHARALGVIGSQARALLADQDGAA